MKTSCLVLLVISGALTLGARDAAAWNQTPQQPEGAVNTASEHPRGAASPDISKPPASSVRTGKRRVQQKNAKTNHVPLPATVAKTNRLKHPLNGHVRSTTATPRSPYQSGLTHSIVVAKNGSIQNKAVSNVSAVQRSSMFPSSSPSLDNLRHRGPNPAVIGGLGTAKPSAAGAINGSRISRKP